MQSRYHDIHICPPSTLSSAAGGILLWDFRIFHRGLQNTTKNRPRPVLYATVAVDWFVDDVNVVREDRSLFAKHVDSQAYCCTRLWVNATNNQIIKVASVLGLLLAVSSCITIILLMVAQ